jgi:hypothetical protein
MRLLLVLFISVVASYCVKQNTSNPVPAIEFKEVANLGKSPYTNTDTATIVLGYEDGDGDLFVNSTEDDYNFIFTPYSYKKNLNAFSADFDYLTNDTFRIVSKIKQPDNGYYKGKSIRGVIYLPLREFRLNDNVDVIKFVGFMIDMKKNKSNVVSSPVYTLNF